jgi:hypothetical protein
MAKSLFELAIGEESEGNMSRAMPRSRRNVTFLAEREECDGRIRVSV